MPLNEEAFIERVSIRHSVSTDAVRTILRALRSGGGTMAQFSHSDFGGMSQWSPGMTMVGDMCNFMRIVSCKYKPHLVSPFSKSQFISFHIRITRHCCTSSIACSPSSF